jgi:hypothetical protein
MLVRVINAPIGHSIGEHVHFAIDVENTIVIKLAQQRRAEKEFRDFHPLASVFSVRQT